MDYLDLVTLKPTQGFTIMGANPGDMSGWSVSGAGYINDDPYADIIIGSPGANYNAGISYVIFGKNNLTNIDLGHLTIEQGFSITGYTGVSGAYSGWSVSGAGDINGDGYSDVIIGVPHAVTNSALTAVGNGEIYVIYGCGKKEPINIYLGYFSSESGFKLIGVYGSYSGYSVNGAGDINGDKIDDIVIGAPYTSPNGKAEAGTVYVIYGSKKPSFTIKLDSLLFNQGFSIIGAKAGDQIGSAVSSAGDINGDGYDDIVIGVPRAFHAGGTSYIIYGKNGDFSNIDLENSNSFYGFSISSKGIGDQSGYSVSGIGDMNKDGYDDLIIGAPGANSNTGNSYIIYGQEANFTDSTIEDLIMTQGFYVEGMQNDDKSGFAVSRAGDVNGDGYDDAIISSPQAYDNAGISYVIYGSDTTIQIPSESKPKWLNDGKIVGITIGGFIFVSLVGYSVWYKINPITAPVMYLTGRMNHLFDLYKHLDDLYTQDIQDQEWTYDSSEVMRGMQFQNQDEVY